MTSQPGFAALTAINDTDPRGSWETIYDSLTEPDTLAILQAMQDSTQGRAGLEESRRQWAGHGLVPPWAAPIETVPLADAVPDPDALPAGTTASRCIACGETRVSYPGDLTDEWKKHFDYCTWPEVTPQ